MSKSNSGAGENRCSDCGLFVSDDTPCARCSGQISYELGPADRTGRKRFTDEALIDALSAAIDDGRSLTGGGPTPKEVADYCPLAPDTVKDRLHDLAEEGRIQKTWGVGDRPKMTYELLEDDDE